MDAHIANERKADDLAAAVVKTFEDYGIPFEDLLQLMTDNPIVMCSLYTGIVTQLKQKYADHLLDIGGCSLHHLTNGAKKSVKELYRYEEIEDFVQDLYTFFTHDEFIDKFRETSKLFKYCVT